MRQQRLRAGVAAAGQPLDYVRAEAHRCADVIAEKGDVLQYGGKGCAEAFNALAEGLALGSLVPGGVTFRGRHWCSDHAACEAAERAARRRR